MTAVLIDANVLLDVMTQDARWFAWSAMALEHAAERHRLIINPIIYAEVSARYSRIEDLDEALPRSMFDREAIPYEAAFLAGKAFLAYRRRGGTKHALLPDFFIGAHAAVAGYRLMTRDAVRYRTYFPKLSLIEPSRNLHVAVTAPKPACNAGAGAPSLQVQESGSFLKKRTKKTTSLASSRHRSRTMRDYGAISRVQTIAFSTCLLLFRLAKHYSRCRQLDRFQGIVSAATA